MSAISSMTVAQLKRSRTTRHTNIRSQITDINLGIANNDRIQVEDGLFKLLSKETDLAEVVVHLELLTTDPDELDVEVAINTTFKDEILDCKVKANRFLSPATLSTFTPTVSGTASATARAPAPVSIKLPKLQIKRFDGTISDWERFFDHFSSSVHNNATLSSVDKFSYLKGLLSESAALTISGLTLTDANYQIAFDLLRNKYGKTEVLIDEHLRKLWATAKVHQSENGQELRRMLETFKMHITSLKNLGKDVNAMGTMLCHILRQALPSSILLEWNRLTKGKCNDNLSQLMDFVQQELEGIEDTWRTNNAKADITKPINRKEREYEATATSLIATSNPSNAPSKFQRRTPPPCLFCSSNLHTATNCTTVPNYNGRIAALRKAGRCTYCMGRNHEKSTCKFTIQCRICGRENHHTLLCWKKLKGDQSRNTERPPPIDRSAPMETTPKVVDSTKTLVASSATASHQNRTQRVSVLQTIRVWVKHPKGMKQVVLLLDGGSEQSFVSERLVQELKLPQLKEEPLTIFSFGGKYEKTTSRRVPLTLVGANGCELDISALQIKEICSGVTLWETAQVENFLKSKTKYNWLQIMGKGEAVTVDILIGADWYWRFLTGHMKRINTYLMATESIFGWLLQGSTSTTETYTRAVSLFTRAEKADQEMELTELNQSLKKLWELDQSGTMAIEERDNMTMDDVDVLRNHNQTTTYQNGRYQVEIPWNNKQSRLGNNFLLAKERLRKLLFRLHKDPVLLERYQQGVDEYLKHEHIEEVPLQQAENNALYFLPHHPIVKDDRKTTKLRIVFDGSSHEEGFLSLNQCQHTGPSLNPNIVDLLIRFRWHQVAITSDIAKAFLQIELKPHERDATRFLWTNQVWRKNEQPTLTIYRMTRVLFGMKSSPFLLAATIRHHTKTHPASTPEVRQTIDNNTYVDDMLAGASTYKAAHYLAQEVRLLMEKAGMTLTKWATNNQLLRQQWINDSIIPSDEPIELLKILGLIWDPITDELSFKSAAILKAIEKSPPTKRGILEILARLYDPLGFLTPKTISVKCILQDIWRKKLEWDDPVSEDIAATWDKWKEDLQFLEQIKLPRTYFIAENFNHQFQLHLFCDASPRAYGAVAYFRIKSAQSTSVCLIAAKARVAPMQLISIPRLELLACLVGVRLANTINTALTAVNIPLKGFKQMFYPENLHTYIWSDSKVALQWIKEPPGRWKVFVGRRVQEIQEATLPINWNYCNTKTNVADLLTHGQALKQLVENKTWWHGPEWLIEDSTYWPNSCIPLEDETNTLVLEEEEKKKGTIQLLVQIRPLFPFNTYSSWQRIIRITAWIIRFLSQCRKNNEFSTPYLHYQELQYAELFWLKIIQDELFSEEIEALENKLLINKASRLLCLQPFLDERKMLRLGGRLKSAMIPVPQKHPLILQQHPLVNLFILDCHLQTLHGGIQSTLTKTRKTVWILKGRQVVRTALKDCMKCRRWNAKPAALIEGPLPAARITIGNPFQTTGVDFSGPVFLKEGKGQVKGYICIFTCAVTRAVHLELVSSMGIKPFLLALRRFIARRGAVQLFYSDNAQTFKQANKLLEDSWKNCQHEETQNLVASKKIEWRFQPPLAPWWGGFFERLIGSVKHHLRRTLGNALLTPEEFSTILAEVESIINCRPLAKMTDDPDDHEYLTPSHFLLGRADGALTDIIPGIATSPVRPMMLRRWQYRKRLMTRFWNQWSNEYLMQLQSAHKLNVPKEEFPVGIGEVVLVKENRLPRGKWKMARVTEVSEGRDGKVRSVMLKTTSGKILRRAIQHLYPLETL